jgi:hypothetical protein
MYLVDIPLLFTLFCIQKEKVSNGIATSMEMNENLIRVEWYGSEW